MKLTAANKPCNRCGGEISWDKKARQMAETNLPVNLDGSVHSCQPIHPSDNDVTTVPIDHGSGSGGGGHATFSNEEFVLAMNSLTEAINRVADILTGKINTRLTQ